MNQRIPCAALPRGAWAVELLQQSPVPVPQLRKDALCESFRGMPTEEGLINVFFEVITDSPYIADARKAELANAILAGSWQSLPKLLGVTRAIRPGKTTTQRKSMADFKYMAIRIFQKSRKVRQLPVARRRVLGSAILSCQSREELNDFLMITLEHAQTLDVKARTLVANDVLEGKYHRLLLADRFDCDDVPRLSNTNTNSKKEEEEDEEDCIICFGTYDDNQQKLVTLSACGHGFCAVCIEDWAKRHGDPFACPTCRARNSLKVVSSSSSPSTVWSRSRAHQCGDDDEYSV